MATSLAIESGQWPHEDRQAGIDALVDSMTPDYVTVFNDTLRHLLSMLPDESRWSLSTKLPA